MKMSTEFKAATVALSKAMESPPASPEEVAVLLRALQRYSAASFDDGHRSALLVALAATRHVVVGGAVEQGHVSSKVVFDEHWPVPMLPAAGGPVSPSRVVSVDRDTGTIVVEALETFGDLMRQTLALRAVPPLKPRGPSR